MVALADLIKTSPLILPVVVSLFSVWAHASGEECNADLTAIVGKYFRLNQFYASSEKIVTEHCKPWPTDSTKTLSLFVYDNDLPKKNAYDDDLPLPKKKLLLALVDSNTNSVLSSYSGWMPEENAVTRVGRGSARLDTAPFVLSKRTRAFGVVFDTTWLPCAVDGGTGQELRLFVGEGKRIRPVFENSTPIYYWRRETTDCFNPGKTFSTPVTVSVLQTASNGFFDLKLTAIESEDIYDSQGNAVRRRSFSYPVKYDGRNYDLSTWNVKFRCWYDRSTCAPP